MHPRIRQGIGRRVLAELRAGRRRQRVAKPRLDTSSPHRERIDEALVQQGRTPNQVSPYESANNAVRTTCMRQVLRGIAFELPHSKWRSTARARSPSADDDTSQRRGPVGGAAPVTRATYRTFCGRMSRSAGQKPRSAPHPGTPARWRRTGPATRVSARRRQRGERTYLAIGVASHRGRASPRWAPPAGSDRSSARRRAPNAL